MADIFYEEYSLSFHPRERKMTKTWILVFYYTLSGITIKKYDM